MRVLGIVTARGGSKGVPRKNVRPIAGKPLIAWTAAAAAASTRLARTVVSTDDDEIARIARESGLEVPFMRPAELAKDDTPTLPVLQHVVRMLEAAGDRYDAVCLLQPTNPCRTGSMIDDCIALLESSQADSVISVLPIPAEHHPCWAFFGNADGDLRLAMGGTVPIPRRQDLPPAFHRDGSIYVTRRDVLLGGSLYGTRVVGHAVEASRSVNIDSFDDWARAEALLSAMGA